MYNWQKDHCIDTAKATKMHRKNLEGKVIIGEMSPVKNGIYRHVHGRLSTNAR